jgi:hypothetical protein
VGRIAFGEAKGGEHGKSVLVKGFAAQRNATARSDRTTCKHGEEI